MPTASMSLASLHIFSLRDTMGFAFGCVVRHPSCVVQWLARCLFVSQDLALGSFVLLTCDRVVLGSTAVRQPFLGYFVGLAHINCNFFVRK